MCALGHSQPGRGNSKSSYVAEDGVRFSALAASAGMGLIAYDGNSCSPLFFGVPVGSRMNVNEHRRPPIIAAKNADVSMAFC
jgi:hypothetical protein